MPSRAPRGLFITLEGGDGSGKSPKGSSLAERLRAEGYAVCQTRDPAGTELGRRLWSLFQRRTEQKALVISPRAELLLFTADRAQHVQQVIEPALARREIVISDRFADSTVAYQAYGRGLSLELVRACNEIATDGLKPDLTLLFDVPPEVGLTRARDVAGERDVIGR